MSNETLAGSAVHQDRDGKGMFGGLGFEQRELEILNLFNRNIQRPSQEREMRLDWRFAYMLVKEPWEQMASPRKSTW